MPQYVIERDLPGAGKLSPAELKAISQKSLGVLSQMGTQIQWVHSYVTGNKIYCVYRAPNEEMLREHARQGGFPATVVSEVTSVIDPTTAEQYVWLDEARKDRPLRAWAAHLEFRDEPPV